jgi:hypothetical protein
MSSCTRLASCLWHTCSSGLQAAFLHKFVRNQESRIKQTGRTAAWRQNAHTTKCQALRTESELQQLVCDLKDSGTVHVAFCLEWVEQERQSQLSLHELKLQCTADVAKAQKGLITAQLAEQHLKCAEQMDQSVWDLTQEVR